MKDSLMLSGVVLYSAPVGENDRRIVVLTKENGRVTMFASGCRKATSPLGAFTRPFTFARFYVYPGKDSYRLLSAEMTESFDGVAADYDALTYGTYFLELAGYFAEENVAAADEVDLLYLTIKALTKKILPCRLVRAIYELRLLTIQGIAPRVFDCVACDKPIRLGSFATHKHGMLCTDCAPAEGRLLKLDEAATYAMQYTESCELLKLYSFKLEENAMNSFCNAMKQYISIHVNKHFKSLDMILD